MENNTKEEFEMNLDKMEESEPMVKATTDSCYVYDPNTTIGMDPAVGVEKSESEESDEVPTPIAKEDEPENNVSEVTIEHESSENAAEDARPQQPQQDTIRLVAIPFINDGVNNVQLFYNSMFESDGSVGAVLVAERYFFNCFNNDDVPKWDGVLLCQYNFTKDGIIKDDRNGFVRLRDFKSKWLWNVSGAREDVTFNVKCTMPKVWASHFQSFLKEMERYGQLGHSGQISFMADGDGNFKPKFKFTKEYESVQGIQSQQIVKKAEQLFDAG